MFSFSCETEEHAEKWILHLLKAIKSYQTSSINSNVEKDTNQSDEIRMEYLLQTKDNYIQSHPDSSYSLSDIVHFLSI